MFLHTIKTKSGKVFNLKELTFFRYKELCKTLYYETDTNILSQALNNLLNDTIHGIYQPIDVLEKIIILLEIRSLTLGNDIKIRISGKNISLDIPYILKAFNNTPDPIEERIGNMVLRFCNPYNFNTSYTSKTAILLECLESVQINNNIILLQTYTTEEKQKIFDFLPGIPISNIIKKLFTKLEEAQLKLCDELCVSPFDETIIYFLKAILIEPYSEVLETEYILRRNIGINTYDLQHMPYPECKIMITKLAKEKKELDNTQTNVAGTPNIPQ